MEDEKEKLIKLIENGDVTVERKAEECDLRLHVNKDYSCTLSVYIPFCGFYEFEYPSLHTSVINDFLYNDWIKDLRKEKDEAKIKSEYFFIKLNENRWRGIWIDHPGIVKWDKENENIHYGDSQ